MAAGRVLRVVVDGCCEEAGAGVVVLPRLGESVWLARGAGEPVVGVWIGLRAPLPAAGQDAAGQPAGEQAADGPVTARVLVEGAVVEHTAQPSAFDARTAVLTVEAPDAPAALEAPVAPAGALRALAQLAGALDAQAAEHAAQV
ncbi:hypothetical protein, partial [Geodermatophilus obscurus]|uniref:hypothetical protein n=1 Tax=Geodermatophilus obscurus TaxID=1861 RepID=UPI001AD8A8F8